MGSHWRLPLLAFCRSSIFEAIKDSRIHFVIIACGWLLASKVPTRLKQSSGDQVNTNSHIWFVKLLVCTSKRPGQKVEMNDIFKTSFEEIANLTSKLTKPNDTIISVTNTTIHSWMWFI